MGHNFGQAFTPVEDVVLLRAIVQHGREWVKVTKFFNSHESVNSPRTMSSLRNRWQRIDRGSADANNACTMCQQPKMGHICCVELGKTKKWIDRLVRLARKSRTRTSTMSKSSASSFGTPTPSDDETSTTDTNDVVVDGTPQDDEHPNSNETVADLDVVCQDCDDADLDADNEDEVLFVSPLTAECADGNDNEDDDEPEPLHYEWNMYELGVLQKRTSSFCGLTMLSENVDDEIWAANVFV